MRMSNGAMTVVLMTSNMSHEERGSVARLILQWEHHEAAQNDINGQPNWTKGHE